MAKDFGALADSVIAAAKGFVQRGLDAVGQRIDELEQRIATIPAGPAGKDGADGKDGRDGTDGVIGATGERGERGEPGLPGKDGRDGVDGKDGASGTRGEKGDPGDAGPAGKDGVDGKDGAAGLAGKDGRDGVDGKDGAAGLNGKDGKDGIDGKDGAPGLNGKDGAQGERGEKGLDGAPGKDGAPGIHGEKGIDGAPGQDGRDGRDGQDGEPGRDALDIDVMDGIDVTRSYPRGTFAAFKGGTFRAARATDPLEDFAKPVDAGWQCVFRGVDSTTFGIEDGGRYLLTSVKFCDGSERTTRQKTAMAIYRGVYQVGRRYDAGDSVTFDGSQWTAKADTDERPRARPLEGEQVWQLSTKRGAPGKDASGKVERE